MHLNSLRGGSKPDADAKINEFFDRLPPDERVLATKYLRIPLGSLDGLREFAEVYGLQTMEETASKIDQLLASTGLKFGEFREKILRSNSN